MLDMSLRQAKNWFLDRQRVTGAVDQASVRVLAQQGGYVRTTMQRLMRYRKKASPPGEPPSAHPTWIEEEQGPDGKVRTKKRGALLREMLYFAWDAAKRSVVIGPVRLGKSAAPATLEYGGYVRRRNLRRRIRRIGAPGEIRLESGRPVYAPLATQAQVNRANAFNEQLYGPLFIAGRLAPRPYRTPALTKSRPALARMWREALKRRSS